MLVKIDDFAKDHGISSVAFEDYLKSHYPNLIQVVKGRFGSKEEAFDDVNGEAILKFFKDYEEQQERERQKRMESYDEPLRKRREEEAARIRDKEIKNEQKREFAESFDEFYEYTIVTILNRHDRIDTEKYVEVLNEKAKDGWRLRTVHTNELGKDAIRILGFGVNSTVSEDALIFERRIPKGMERSKDTAQL